MKSFEEILKEPLPSKLKLESIYIELSGINLEDGLFIFNEAKADSGVNLGKRLSSVVIEIRNLEGENKPHFHIISKNTKKGKRFETCIRLDTNAYFRHKDTHGILNKNNLKNLVEYLESPYKNTNLTIYQFLCNSWNNHPGYPRKVNPNQPIPDYINIREDNEYDKANKKEEK